MLRRKEKFLDEQHKSNFEKLKSKWEEINVCSDYRTAGYILAFPPIYKTVKKDIKKFKYPVDWITNFLEKGNPGKYELDVQLIQLGKLSLSLWDEYPFNLGECVDTLTGVFYEVLKEVMEMRKKFEVSYLDIEEHVNEGKNLYINGYKITPDDVKDIISIVTGARNIKNAVANKTPRGMFEKRTTPTQS